MKHLFKYYTMYDLSYTSTADTYLLYSAPLNRFRGFLQTLHSTKREILLLVIVVLWVVALFSISTMHIFTWYTGSRLCLSINWCKQTSRGAALNSTQKRTQVAHGHLLNERSPIFTKIPPLKYLWWKQKVATRFTKKLIILLYPRVDQDQWLLNLFCHATVLIKTQKLCHCNDNGRLTV